MMDQINPEALVSAAGRSGGGAGGAGAAPAGTVTVSLSPKDQEAIANVRIYFTRTERDEIVRGSNLVDRGRWW